jgi:hypothetical protein
VSHPSNNSIRNAVRDCLARCYAGDTPLGVIAECIAQLREQGWSQNDIRAVEMSVRKVMAGLVVDDDSGDGNIANR